MTLTACILKPRGPFHVGEREGMREGSGHFIHSDTLFSAFCHSFLLLYGSGELERFLDAENGSDPPFVFSSAFPAVDGVFYFPVPRSLMPKDKKAKRLSFIRQTEFEAAIVGKTLPDKALADAGLPAGVVTTDDVPRVSLSRTSGTADQGGFYHVGLTWYGKDASLYFLARFGPGEWQDKVKAAIRLMCDEGVGGYRTVGHGQFEQPEFRDIDLNVPGPADGRLVLSLYYPAEAELTGLTEGWYDLVQCKGYVFSPVTRSLRRKQVTMFVEGSVFPGLDRKGQLADVTPDEAGQLGLKHKVWRNGLAFTVPCVLPNQAAARGYDPNPPRIRDRVPGSTGGDNV